MRAARVIVPLLALLAVLLVAPPAQAADCGKPARHFRVAALGDIIDVDSRHDRVFNALCRSRWDVIVTLGDQVHKNAPARLWRREWMPTYGSLPACDVWSVLGNHEWGWGGGGRKPAYGSTYRQFRAEFLRCPGNRPDLQWVKKQPGWFLVGLNSEKCTAATKQIRRLMDYNMRRDRNSVAVFFHRPLTLPPGSRAPRFPCPSLQRELDRPRVKVVVNGHSHRFWTTMRKGTRYLVAGTGGSGGYLGWADLSFRPDGTYSWRFRRL